VEFKWEKTELASMVSATNYLTVALKAAGMPDNLKVFDVMDKKMLFNVKDGDFPLAMSGTSDFIITVERTHSKTHALELHRNTFLVIGLKRLRASLTENENQAFSILMGVDSIQKNHNRLPVVVLTDLKEFIFCWIGKENQGKKFIFYWSTENLQDAAMLMSALAIEEARKAGINVNAPRLPANIAGLQIFNRCKLKDPPSIESAAVTTGAAPMSTESSNTSSVAATPTSTASSHPTNVRRSGRRRRARRDNDDDDDDDFDDQLNLARQVYISALRHFDTWSDNPRFGRPLSSEAANMYV